MSTQWTIHCIFCGEEVQKRRTGGVGFSGTQWFQCKSCPNDFSLETDPGDNYCSEVKLDSATAKQPPKKLLCPFCGSRHNLDAKSFLTEKDAPPNEIIECKSCKRNFELEW